MFSKFMNPLTILIILIVTGIAVHLAFLHFTKSPKILEIRDFSCPGMTGFTFKYPVFEGWEVKDVTKPSSDQDRCLVWLKWPNGSISPTVAPTIQVTKTASPKEIGGLIPGFPGPASPKNPQGITYDVWTETGAYHFFTANFEVKIELSGVSNALGEGFQEDLFFKTVIESFQVFYVAR